MFLLFLWFFLRILAPFLGAWGELYCCVAYLQADEYNACIEGSYWEDTAAALISGVQVGCLIYLEFSSATYHNCIV